MDEWYITYLDDAGDEQLDCVKAESVTHAVQVFIDKLLVECVKIIKVELKP